MKTRVLTAALTAVALAGGGLSATVAEAKPDLPVRAEKAAFVTPSGNMSCVMDETGVTCDAAQHDWPNLQVACEEGEGGNLMRLTDTAAPSCMGDPLRLRAKLGSPLTTYYSDAGAARHDVTLPDGATYAGLDYGTNLENQTYAVVVAQDGVHVLNKRTGHGFTMAKEKVETH